MFCDKKDIFGIPGKGLHSVRVLNLAVVDILATLFVGAILAYYTGVNVYGMWVGLFILGIFVHRLFCVNSTVNMWIFGRV
jgi:hypothetical protein